MIEVFVEGEPAPQGSKNVYRTRSGRAVVVEANPKLKQWRGRLKTVLRSCVHESFKPNEPVLLVAVFWLRRPKNHFRTGRFAGQLKKNAPKYASVKPDGDKYLRAVCDGLTDAGVVADDGQIVVHHCEKRYCNPGEPQGVMIRAASLEVPF